MRLTELFDPAMFKVAALTSSAASGAASIATVDLTMGVLGVPLSVFLAGFAGALVSLSFLPPPVDGQDVRKTVFGMVGHVGSGTLLAAFSEPLVWWAIEHYLSPASPLPDTLHLGVAGLLGALLMLVLPIGVQWIRKLTGAAA